MSSMVLFAESKHSRMPSYDPGIKDLSEGVDVRRMDPKRRILRLRHPGATTGQPLVSQLFPKGQTLTYVDYELLSLHPYRLFATAKPGCLFRLRPWPDALWQARKPGSQFLVQLMCQLDSHRGGILRQIHLHADLASKPGEVHHVLYYGTVGRVQERRVQVARARELGKGELEVVILVSPEAAWSAKCKRQFSGTS